MKAASLVGLALATCLGVSAYLLPSQRHSSKFLKLAGKEKTFVIPGRWIDGESLRSADEVSATRAELVRHALMLAKNKMGKARPGVATDKALLALIDNKPEIAFATLREALRFNPGDVTLLNNIVVVELVKADHGNSRSLVDALDNIEQCLRAQPRSLEAIFNRALILERFSLAAAARDAWLDYIDKEADEFWRDLAREHIDNLAELSSEEKWREASLLLQRVADAGDDGKVAELVFQFCQQSRILIQEEVLVRWAQSRLSGDRVKAAKELAIAKHISQALLRVNGEASANDAVIEIEGAEERGLATDLAKGYLIFKQGLERYQALQPQEAFDLIGKAQNIFEAIGCRSLLLWTDFWLGGSEYYLGNREAAKDRIEKTLAAPEISQYPALRGRALWSRGLIMLVNSDFSSSLASYKDALQDFERIGELENAGAVQALMAENFHLLGEEGQAWKSRILALEKLKLFPSSVRLHNALSEAADQLVTARLPWVAQYFYSEDLRVSQRTGSPATVAEALLLRGRNFFALGRTDDAWTGMREAQKYIANIADLSTREKLESEADLAIGELVDFNSARQVLNDLTHAVVYYERTEISPLAALAYIMRAKTLLLLNQDAQAVSDLIDAIKLHEEAVNALDGVEAKSSYRNQWQLTFDKIIEIEALQRKDPLKALDFVEYAKSGQWRPNVYAAVAPKLRAGDVLVEYALLPRNVLIWIITSDGLQFTSEQVDQERLESLVGKFLNNLEGSRENLSGSSRLLCRILVRPVVIRASGAIRWFLIPDRAIGRIPFAALLDSESGRYLIEDRSLVYEPSFGPIITGEGEGGEVTSGPILVVGNPTVDPKLYPGVEALPGAESEAREVAALYGQSTILAEKVASRANFLRSIKLARVVHFAGHAFFSENDPYSSKIIFAPSESYASSEISARELARMDLKWISLLVVSACDVTPKGVGDRGGASGIADALLDAGVHSIVAARWPIADGESKGLLISMHRKLLAGKSRAEGLREVQVEAIQHGISPKLWAAFGLFGCGW